MPIVEGERRALDLASEQYGVITRQQARQLDLTDRQIEHRVTEGRWARVHPGVYRVVGAPVSARQRALAACLWVGEEAAVSHTTAARLLRLDGVPKRVPLHVSMPLDVRMSATVKHKSFTLHRVQKLTSIDRVVVDGIPCTSAARTLLDLAAMLGDEGLEIAFESARRVGLTSVLQLAERYTEVGGRGRKGSAKVRRLLEHQPLGARPLESPLEVRTWRLLQRHRLPLPSRQVTLTTTDGTRYRVDFLWPDHALVLECDGFEAHAGHLRWKRDRKRVADIELLGLRLIHVTWDDVVRRSRDTVRRVELGLLHRRLADRPHDVWAICQRSG